MEGSHAAKYTPRNMHCTRTQFRPMATILRRLTGLSVFQLTCTVGPNNNNNNKKVTKHKRKYGSWLAGSTHFGARQCQQKTHPLFLPQPLLFFLGDFWNGQSFYFRVVVVIISRFAAFFPAGKMRVNSLNCRVKQKFKSHLIEQPTFNESRISWLIGEVCTTQLLSPVRSDWSLSTANSRGSLRPLCGPMAADWLFLSSCGEKTKCREF